MTFSSRFSGGAPYVFASLNHGNISSIANDIAFVWVEDVTAADFKACLVQGGFSSRGYTTIDWLAFHGSQSGVYHGKVSFGLFTTGTKCEQVTFPQVMYEWSLLRLISLAMMFTNSSRVLKVFN